MPFSARASLGYYAERALLAEEADLAPLTLPKSRTTGNTKAGEAATESSQRVILRILFTFSLKKITSQVKVRRRVKILFAQTVSDTGLITAANRNIDKMPRKG